MGAAVLEASEQSASSERSGWSTAARSAGVLELLEARERIDAGILAEMGEWDRDQCWAADDALSAVSWIVHRVPMTDTDASVLVRAARHVAQHEATAKA